MCVDAFAGKRAISMAFEEQGQQAKAHDIVFTDADDAYLQLCVNT